MSSSTLAFFDECVARARIAVQSKSTKVTIFEMAEYLDLVSAGEIVSDFKLTQACKSEVNCFVAEHLLNPAYVSLWERADCLTRAYKRALRAAERKVEPSRTMARV